MKYVTGSLRALKQTLVNFFRPVITEYSRPYATRADRYRASFCLTHDDNGEENCTGCQLCQNICPSRVITVEKGPRKESPFSGKKRGYSGDFTLDLQACLFCELCIQVCPTDAIMMMRVQEEPSFSREELFLTRQKLYENEHDKPVYWGGGIKLQEMQDPRRESAPGDQPAPEPEADTAGAQT